MTGFRSMGCRLIGYFVSWYPNEIPNILMDRINILVNVKDGNNCHTHKTQKNDIPVNPVDTLNIVSSSGPIDLNTDDKKFSDNKE